LVEAGLVQRHADANDARAVVLSLTAEGVRHADQVQELESAMYEHLDRVAGPDAEAAIRFLRAYVEGTPVGESFHLREGQI
jgi:DNA-binding MarR family transcriptional regulator